LRKMNVRLLRGPIHKFALMKPAQRLKLLITAAAKRRIEDTTKRGFLPIRSEVAPAMKLPTA